MKPLDDLIRDHRLISRVIVVLEAAARRSEADGALPVDLLEQGLAFVCGFADGCHHAKEEQALFPILAGKGPMIKGGPVKILTADHEAARRLTKDLDAAIAAMRAGRPEGSAAALKTVRLYTDLLRRHIAKEEEIVYRLAEMLISPDEAAQLAEQFQRIDDGAATRYESLVQGMEQALAASATR